MEFQLLKDLENEWSLLGDYYERVIEELNEFKKDTQRVALVHNLVENIKNSPVEDARNLPLPQIDDECDFFLLLTHLLLVKDGVEGYRQRGFSDKEISSMLTIYHWCVDVVFKKTGKIGLNGRYYWWLFLYAKSQIFNCEGFNFEITQLMNNALLLKNAKTKQTVALMLQGEIHKSGLILGSAGCEDSEDAVPAEFEETSEGWYGIIAENGVASNKKNFLSKKEWTIAVKPGDYIISIHLPRGLDLSFEHTTIALQKAKEIVTLYYSEFDCKAFYCNSWLLDPALKEILGSDSKIARYGERFSRYPIKSNGREVFEFVFPSTITDLNDLPENTRLERALKKMYLAGSFVHSCCGLIIEN